MDDSVSYYTVCDHSDSDTSGKQTFPCYTPIAERKPNIIRLKKHQPKLKQQNPSPPVTLPESSTIQGNLKPQTEPEDIENVLQTWSADDVYILCFAYVTRIIALKRYKRGLIDCLGCFNSTLSQTHHTCLSDFQSSLSASYVDCVQQVDRGSVDNMFSELVGYAMQHSSKNIASETQLKKKDKKCRSEWKYVVFQDIITRFERFPVDWLVYLNLL